MTEAEARKKAEQICEEMDYLDFRWRHNDITGEPWDRSILRDKITAALLEAAKER